MSDKFNTVGVWSTHEPTYAQAVAHEKVNRDPVTGRGMWEMRRLEVVSKWWPMNMIVPSTTEITYNVFPVDPSIRRYEKNRVHMTSGWRLRGDELIRPVRRTADGTFEPCAWPEVE